MVGKDSASCRNKGSSKNLPGFRVQPVIFVLDFNPDPALIHDRLKTEEMARLGRFERPTSGSGGGISGIGSSVLSSLDMSQSASTVLFGHIWVRLCKGLCKEVFAMVATMLSQEDRSMGNSAYSI